MALVITAKITKWNLPICESSSKAFSQTKRHFPRSSTNTPFRL